MLVLPRGRGIMGIFTFLYAKPVCMPSTAGTLFMVKVMPKSQQVNVKLLWRVWSGGFGHGLKSPTVKRHCRNDDELKTWLLSPAIFPPWAGLTNDWCIMYNIFSLLPLSHLMTKPTKWHVRPANTQISLGICPV